MQQSLTYPASCTSISVSIECNLFFAFVSVESVAALGAGNQGGRPGRHLLGGVPKVQNEEPKGNKPPILLKSILKSLNI